MLIFFWPIMALLVAWIASNKGRSLLGWLIYGLLLWPIALIHVVLISNGSKKCSKCYSKIDSRATICPSCKHEFSSTEMNAIAESRKHAQNKKIIVAAVILAVVISIYRLIDMIPSTPTRTDSDAIPTPTQKLEVKTGSYQSHSGKNYDFEIIHEPGNEKTIASFTPFIPKNDANLLEAIFQVFIAYYGKDSQINPTPQIEARNGVNLIKFKGDTNYYYVLTTKEDTGEVHTITFWQE